MKLSGLSFILVLGSDAGAEVNFQKSQEDKQAHRPGQIWTHAVLGAGCGFLLAAKGARNSFCPVWRGNTWSSLKAQQGPARSASAMGTTCNESLALGFPSVKGAGSEQRERDQKDPRSGSLWADFKPVVELKVRPRLQWEDRLDLFLASFYSEIGRSSFFDVSLGLFLAGY